MNILLTGGLGYLGSHAAVALLAAGHQVVLLDNLSNSRAEVADQIAQIAGQPVRLVVGDIRDTALLKQVMQDAGTDAVMHFAGLKVVGDSSRDPLAYYQNNVTGTLSLLQAMKAAGVQRLVFSSSATVYGEPEYQPVDENHPTRALTPYGRTKLQIEQILEDMATSDSEWCIAVLRYFNPVGAHESGLIGEVTQGEPSNLTPYIAQVAAGLRPFLRVYGSDYDTTDGTAVRDFIHVQDLAEGHVAALDFLASHQGCHAFNLGTGRGYTVLEMVNAFAQACARPIPYELVGRREGDVAVSCASVVKAKNFLGWQAQRGLDEMCASIWRWQQSCERVGS